MDHSFIFMFLYFSLTICESNQICNCNVRIKNGYIKYLGCRNEGELYYHCYDGYKRATQNPLICLRAGRWIKAPKCVPKDCQDLIPNGAVLTACKFGSACNYTCQAGYRAAQTSVSCDVSTNWTVNPHSLCLNEFQCPYEIANGSLDINCRRQHGDTCRFTCSKGFKPSYDDKTVYCNSSMIWDPPLYSACSEILCPTTIPNGRVNQACSRRTEPYSQSICSDFECDAGYRKILYPPISLKCNASGHWLWPKDSRPSCIKEILPCPTIKNAKLSPLCDIYPGSTCPPCDRNPGSTCLFTCNSGCFNKRSNGKQVYAVYCQMEGNSNSSSPSKWRFFSQSMSDIVSCECSTQGFSTVGLVLGGIIFLGCIVGGVWSVWKRRAKSKANSSVLYNQTSSAGTSRTLPQQRRTLAAMSRCLERASPELCEQNYVAATEYQSTYTAQPAEYDVTTATLHREHCGVQIPHNEIPVTTQDRLCRGEQTTSAVAERPPSYTAVADIPPSYTPPSYSAAMAELPPSYLPIEQAPPGYSAATDTLAYITEPEAPPRYTP